MPEDGRRKIFTDNRPVVKSGDESTEENNFKLLIAQFMLLYTCPGVIFLMVKVVTLFLIFKRHC